jgi:hypothetical protein
VTETNDASLSVNEVVLIVHKLFHIWLLTVTENPRQEIIQVSCVLACYAYKEPFSKSQLMSFKVTYCFAEGEDQIEQERKENK